jgi:hypothetical protein
MAFESTGGRESAAADTADFLLNFLVHISLMVAQILREVKRRPTGVTRKVFHPGVDQHVHVHRPWGARKENESSEKKPT